MPPSKLALPDDLQSFLASGHQLQYDPTGCEYGRITLLPPDQLELRPFTVFTAEMQHVYGDPRGGKGCYIVPAVRLVAACAHYDPRGVLIWIPDERMFGTWDCDHHIIHVLFAARGTRGGIVEPATWSNIQANPIRYLPPYPGDATSCKLLIPWPKYRWQENW